MEEQNPKNESLQFNSRIDLSKLQEAVAKIKNELGKVIIGQECATCCLN
jgi:MoxR-like ATPase